MNEKPLVAKMRENYIYFGGLSFLYGIIFAFCFYRNLIGITFPICVIITIAFSCLMMKKAGQSLQRDSVLYIAGMLLLGISTACTTSFFLWFFNLVGILLLYFVFMIHQFYEDSNWNLPSYLKRILILMGTTLESIPKPYAHGVGYMSKNQDGETKNEKNKTILAVGVGLLVAIAMLCVILPLLLDSDRIFARIFGELLKHINFSTIFGIGVLFLTGFTLSYAFFCALCKYNFPQYVQEKNKTYNPVIAITFTGVLSVVYLIYCTIQIVYLFVGAKGGLPADLTYSEYARGGFFDLLAVASINLIMVLLCMYLFSENVVLKILLTVISGCTFIMIISAAYRLMLYIGAYHLTRLRVLALWFLIVLTLIMGGMVISMYWRKFPLFRYVVAVVSVLYIGLSLARPDALIAKYNIAHTETFDYGELDYLLWDLSDDAAPAIATIETRQYEYEDMEESVRDYFSFLLEEEENIYFRKANYSRIRASIAAKKYMEQYNFGDSKL